MIDRYLNSHLLNGSFKTTTINQEIQKIMIWLLVIMPFGVTKDFTATYREGIIQTKRGYLIMNTGIENYNESRNKLKIDEIKILPDIKLLKIQDLVSQTTLSFGVSR